LRIHYKQRIAILLIGGLVCLGTACSKSNPSEALQKELKRVVSWIETTRAVGEAFKNGSVPPAYAARTFQTAQKNLQQEIENIQSLSISESIKADLLSKLQQFENSLGQAEQAVGNSDRQALEQTLSQMTTAGKAFAASTK
jgi:molecular chaperone GrpE (heat shock protein)